MNYEQKYKEALEKARQFSERPLEEDSSTIVEYIFPELKESEDERIRKELITHCRNTRCVTEEGAERIAKWIAWLEKQGEKKSSDEVLKIRQEVYQSGYNDGYKHGIEDVKQGEQKSHAWSKEDERNLKGIIDEIEANKNTAPDYDLATYDRFLSWLKSIKKRVQPQNTWKPSEEQMGVIEAVINNRSFQRRHLDSLYNDLKKLKVK